MTPNGHVSLDTLRPKQIAAISHTFRMLFFNENNCVFFQMQPKFVPKVPVDKKLAIVPTMVWRLTDRETSSRFPLHRAIHPEH